MAKEPGNPREVATWIVRTLRDHGHVAYFAGGCVRDELLGLPPKDYDVATDARPEQISALFPRTAHVGAAFGVILVRHDQITTEVATFRADGEYTDRRRPDSVTFSDAVADAKRRDFTINALFLDPLRDASDPNRVIDHVGGVRDLAAKTLRAVGDADKRLAEDDLRALRAVRLSTRLSFAIDPGTAAAIRRHATELAGVSKERIGDEIRLMLNHPSRANAMEMLAELGLDLPTFARALKSPPVTPRYPRLARLRTNDAGSHTVFPLALATTLLDREGDSLIESSPAADGHRLDVLRDTRAALCLSNEERDECLAILKLAAVLVGPWSALPVASQKRAASGKAFPGAIALVRTFAEATTDAAETRVRALSGTFGGLSPIPLLNGDDLVGAGFSPGPKFRKILDTVYDAQLEGRISTPEAALALARSLARELAAEGGV